MLKFESRHLHQSASRAARPESHQHQQRAHHYNTHTSAGRHVMDSLLSTIQDQYFSAVASTLSRAIVLASSAGGAAVGQPRCQKVSPNFSSNDSHQKQPKSLFVNSQAQQQQQQEDEEACRRQQQQSTRRRALNKQQHQRQNNGLLTNPTTTPLDLSKRRLTDDSEPPTSSCSDRFNNLNLAPTSSSLLFPLNLVTKSEVTSATCTISAGSRLAVSSTVSPSSTSESPTSSLSSSSATVSSSAGPVSSEFETRQARSRIGAEVGMLKSQDKRQQQRRRPTKKLKGAKNHMCGQCGRSFSRSDMLTRHSRLHSGLKPYQCAKCLQVFSRSDHLSTHERTHTGEKPYQCKFCSYSACRRDMITRHMRTHTLGTGGALANPNLNSALSMSVNNNTLTAAAQTTDPTRANVQKSQQRTRRRQNTSDEADGSLEHKFFQLSETGPTQQLVPTKIEHFHNSQ